jgi:hypothetical protein
MFERFKSDVHNKKRLKWEKKREQGKRSFLVRRGILRWGGIMFVLTALSNVLVRHGKVAWIPMASLLIGCLLFGYIWALCVWLLNEERFGFKGTR